MDRTFFLPFVLISDSLACMLKDEVYRKQASWKPELL